MTNPAILFATGFAVALLAGCGGPSPSLNASIQAQPANERPATTEPIVLISASGLSPQTDYLVGLSTVWSPEFAARVRSNPLGSIPPTPVHFACPYVNVPPLGVGLFLPDGVAVARTITAMPICNVPTPMLTPINNGISNPAPANNGNSVPGAARG